MIIIRLLLSLLSALAGHHFRMTECTTCGAHAASCGDPVAGQTGFVLGEGRLQKNHIVIILLQSKNSLIFNLV